MIERLKDTLRDAFIYSLSNIAPKIIGVVLLPIYTAYLSRAEFGSWDLLDVTTNILAEIFLLGQAASIIFINNSNEYNHKKQTALFTLTLFLLSVCILLILFSEFFITTFGNIFDNPVIKPIYLRIIVWIVLFRTLNNLFLSKYRADEKALFFSSVSIVKLLIIAALTLYFLIKLNKGIEGIFFSALIGEAVVAIFLIIKLLGHFKLKFDMEILRFSIKFGVPLTFTSLGIMLLNLSDRYIITYLIGTEANALYGLGYRIAGILNMVLIMPFGLSLMPIAYKYYGQPDDKRFFSKIMTYSTFLFIWGCIAISLFSKEIVKIFSEKPEYYDAYLVVPVILISYAFSGMRLTASLGMMLTKNTKHIATITLGAAILNIILNFIFIPYFGIMAAAINTLIAFVLFYIVTHIISDKYYKIPYEKRKIILLIVVGSVLSSFVYLLPAGIEYIFVKVMLIVLFPFILYLLKFYENIEKEYLMNPKKIFDALKGIYSKNN